MQIKVCHLSSAHSAFDDRVFHKEAKTLSRAGYNVTIIVQHNKKETIDGVEIVPLPMPTSRFERMTKIVWKSFRLASKQKAVIYHFHDPELIPIGLALKLFGRKVIYDVHEDYPEQILNKEWIGSYTLRKIMSVLFNIFEKLSVKIFDGVATVTPDITAKFPENKTITLRNLPILELIDKAKPSNRKKNKPTVIYSGGLSRIRGIKEIIQAMDFIENKANLWLLGEWESEKFKQECENLTEWNYATYLGQIPYGQHYSLIKTADVGLINFFPVPNQERAMPNKPFEYMACSLPMVMSNFPYWQELFGECALFVNPYDAKDIAEKILHLLDNSNEAKKLGDKGRELIEEEYNWEAESQKLIDLYKGLLNGNKPS
ncbi:MAG: glycosyltransferase family 4 protein [Phycisphaerae bacterium]|nr:glycosyltransferase family 4 protein [Phycisphaerae bacterium]MDD5380271.1 glycosyltransferase family 4 protein [Phycisphaerae bacterium]